MSLYEYGVFVLFALAICDLVVGVSNDAVNFLNSSVGSRVAPRRVIFAVASLGILAGVTFSSGMMEVARKGIFNPQYFTMPELMVVFLAVMLTDVILLDLYNTFGMPTSTTVSIVFALLGSAVAVSLLKLYDAGMSLSGFIDYINTAKALTIIFGILLSVGVAFIVGAVVQFFSRLLFTFDFETRLRRCGALWGGMALAAITFFILIKGARGSSFITVAMLDWINGHTGLILLVTFGLSALLLQLLLAFTRVHILRVVVLCGTFALAMAFAANDLVNFIGVPLAGMSAFRAASGSDDPAGRTMEALAQPVRVDTLVLLGAGAVMVATLLISRKARTVTRTEVSLGRQEEGFERFESTRLSRIIVRTVAALFNVSRFLSVRLKEVVLRRMDHGNYRPTPDRDGIVASFDLIRAAVNLMVASALIAWATSMKLPLSTTYVTFMVAMGTSLADQAWGRDSAVYRVSGVLTVIGGWFFTAMMAFSVSLLFAVGIYLGGAPVVAGLLVLAGLLIARTHLVHRRRERAEQATEVFNLRKITDSTAAIGVTFDHAGIFLQEVGRVLESGFDGLFQQNRQLLRSARVGQRRIQLWSNIIVANIFKVLRLLDREDVVHTQRYAQTISTLQEISESTRDIVLRADLHVANHHADLLDVQVEELRRIRQGVVDILDLSSAALLGKERPKLRHIRALARDLKKLSQHFDRNQIKRIQDNSSKTRLSILFYAFMWDALKIAEQTKNLLDIFEEPLRATIETERTDEAAALPPAPAARVLETAAGSERLEV